MSGKFTKKEIADGIANINDVGASLTSMVRAREGAKGAEKAVRGFIEIYYYFKRGVTTCKNSFIYPTHLRNFYAGAFAGANGILFEGITNPNLLRKTFAEGGIDASTLETWTKSHKQSSLRELELGVVNSQVQIEIL